MDTLRKEVQTFVAGCEHLIALCSKTALTAEEEQLLAYYIAELNRLACRSRGMVSEAPPAADGKSDILRSA